MPIAGLTFENVRVADPPADGVWGTDYYFCEGVGSGVALGNTWPVPKCMEDRTSQRTR